VRPFDQDFQSPVDLPQGGLGRDHSRHGAIQMPSISASTGVDGAMLRRSLLVAPVVGEVKSLARISND